MGDDDHLLDRPFVDLLSYVIDVISQPQVLPDGTVLISTRKRNGELGYVEVMNEVLPEPGIETRPVDVYESDL